MLSHRLVVGSTLLVLSAVACRQTESPTLADCDLQSIPYAPNGYAVQAPQGFPDMVIPENNRMTVEGINLGRHLFYDPILSMDSTISCSSCHKIEHAFTDGEAVSKGVNGLVGSRSSMGLINVGYNWVPSRPHNFMWDGRFATLEEQAVMPIVDPVEMANTWENVEQTLRAHPTYPQLFREAFGIDCKDEITIDMVGKALAQFERTLNSANSRYDQRNTTPLSAQEERGRNLFFGRNGAKNAECARCHGAPNGQGLFARNNFSNNGLDNASTLMDFPDLGFGAVTGNAQDNGKFREVTLRNIGLTAPYMHDGRFATLEEVMDHYASGGHPSPNLARELRSPSLRSLTQTEKDDIVAFLHTLSDDSYVQGRPEWLSPF